MSPQHPIKLTGCTVLAPMETASEPAPEPGRTKKSKQAGQRFQTINEFCDATMKGVHGAKLAIWLLLWRDTKPNGLAQASQANLARRAGVDARTVGRAIRGLQQMGLLNIVRKGGLSQGPSTYKISPRRKEVL